MFPEYTHPISYTFKFLEYKYSPYDWSLTSHGLILLSLLTKDYSDFMIPCKDLELSVIDLVECPSFVFLSLNYITQYGLFKFYPFTCKVHDFIFLYAWMAFHSIYAQFLHCPFVTLRASGMLPLLNYCKQMSNEHGWASISGIVYSVCWVYAKEWNSGLYGCFIFRFLKVFHIDSHSGWKSSTLLTINDISLLIVSIPTFIVIWFFWTSPFWLE